MILNFRYRLVNNHLVKVFYIVEKDSKQKSMFPNDAKLRINVIDQLDTDLFMDKNKSISAVENNIKKLHIQKNMHLIYKQDFYKDEQKEIDKLFIE